MPIMVCLEDLSVHGLVASSRRKAIYMGLIRKIVGFGKALLPPAGDIYARQSLQNFTRRPISTLEVAKGLV